MRNLGFFWVLRNGFRPSTVGICGEGCLPHNPSNVDPLICGRDWFGGFPIHPLQEPPRKRLTVGCKTALKQPDLQDKTTRACFDGSNVLNQ